MTKEITPDQLGTMIQAVIDAGRETNLLPPSSLETLRMMITAAHKRHARHQVKVALAARKQVALVNTRRRRAKYQE